MPNPEQCYYCENYADYERYDPDEDLVVMVCEDCDDLEDETPLAVDHYMALPAFA